MKTRLSLQTKLQTILGSNRVYYQPPESVKLVYPCILYHLTNDKVNYANDGIYKRMNHYSITLIDKNPETSVADELRKLPYCSFDRTYVSNNLNHFVYTIFY